MKVIKIEELDNNLRIKVKMSSVPKSWAFEQTHIIKLKDGFQLLIKLIDVNRDEKYVIAKKFQPCVYIWTTYSYRKTKTYKIGVVNFQSVGDRLSQTDTTGVAEDIELVEQFPLFVKDPKDTFKIEKEIHNTLGKVRKNREFVRGDLKKVILPTVKEIITNYKISNSPYNQDIPTPRYYQYYGKLAAGDYFYNNDRGWFQWFCRTGKTNGTFWMYQEIFARIKPKNNIVLIFVPNLQLVNQTHDDWVGIATQYDLRVKSIKIGDDDEMTTDENKICSWIKESTKDTLNLIVSTYHSSDKVSTATKMSGVTIDLIINDEAHKITGNDGKSWKRCLFNNFIKRRKTISTTASPIEYTSESIGFSGFENEQMFGKKFHEYLFLDAMFDGVISPLQILGIEVSDDVIGYVNRLIEQRRNIIQENFYDFGQIDLSGIDDEINLNQGRAIFYIQLHNTLTCLKEGIFSHPIIQANSIKTLTYFFACLKALAPEYGVNLEYAEIFTSKNSKSKDRIKSLNKFGSYKLAAVGNVYCFQEGITIPCADGCVMIDPRYSGPNIIQSSSRPLGLDRSNPNKMATFLLPIVVQRDEEGRIILNRSMWSQTRDWMLNMCETDEDLKKYVLNDLRFYTPKIKSATDVRDVRPDNRALPGVTGRAGNNPVERQIESVDFKDLLDNMELMGIMSTKKHIGNMQIDPEKQELNIKNQSISYILGYKTKIEHALNNHNPKHIKKYNDLIKSADGYIEEITVKLNVGGEDLIFIKELSLFNELIQASTKLKEKNIKQSIKLL